MAAEVVSQNDWFSWSLNQFAREFGIARETVQSRLRMHDIKPSGERRGFPVYRVSEAAKAILIQPNNGFGLVTNDPEKMSPKERRDYFEGSIAKKKLDELEGISVSRQDARMEMAVIAKTGLQVLETLPDILERDYALDSKIIIDVEARIDALREQWANLIEEVEA